MESFQSVVVDPFIVASPNHGLFCLFWRLGNDENRNSSERNSLVQYVLAWTLTGHGPPSLQVGVSRAVTEIL